MRNDVFSELEWCEAVPEGDRKNGDYFRRMDYIQKMREYCLGQTAEECEASCVYYKKKTHECGMIAIIERYGEEYVQ